MPSDTASMRPPVTRFAPSPTGKLHVGNARVALVNWLIAKAAGGQFILRLDDTDDERSTEAFAQAIRDDLCWLGLLSDQEFKQSDRLALYDEATEKLKASGRLYPCYETPEELSLKRKVQLQQGRPPIYDRAALSLSDDDKAKFEAEGRKPHWRFKMAPGEIAWTDHVRGPVKFDAAKLSDPVLIRADGRPLYHLPSVVDDIEMGVTHVLRGEDHVDNTAMHVQLFQALGAQEPEFAHLSLMTDQEGKGLSKRTGSLSLESLREEGVEAMAILSYLARIGTSEPVEPKIKVEDIRDGFAIQQFGRATPKFDPRELHLLNARILHELPYTQIAPRLESDGLSIEEDFWLAVRPNLSKLSDVADWLKICSQDLCPVIADEDKAFMDQALALLPAGPWDGETWGVWTKALKGETGRKGKGLFMPLRKAITGLEHGPELAGLLPLIGEDRVKKRLQGQTA